MELRIGELARLAQCPVVTIRFYEKEGLLAPSRSRGNYRLYGEADIERLRFVLHCRLYDMPLSRIRELLAIRDNPAGNCAAAHQILDEHLASLDARIQLLTKFRNELEALKSRHAASHENGCPLMRKLNSPDRCKYCENLREYGL